MRHLCRLLVAAAVPVFAGLAQTTPKPPEKAPLKPTEPVPVSVLINHHLPKWIQFSGEYRSRIEGFSGGGFRRNSSDAYWLSRPKLDLTIQPVSWFKAVGELMDARAVFKNAGAPPFENVWDIHLAYGELGDMDKGKWAVRVGRQELAYGDTRVIAPSNWSNASRSFDAVRAAMNLKKQGVRVEMFSASVVANVNDTWDHHQDSNNLHGVYSDFSKVIPKVDIQPYFLWRLQPRVRNEAGLISNVNERMPGLRVTGTLPSAFDYRVEVNGQFGSVGSDSIRAWSGHWSLGRTWKKVRFTPRAWGEYSYMSGDRNSRDGVRETYDSIYPNTHDKLGFAYLFSGRNLKDIRGGVETKLPHGINATLEYNDWYLASRFDSLFTPQGAVIARSAAGTAGTHIGNEVDLLTTFRLPRSVQGAAGVAYIIPGAFLKNTTPGKAYIYPFVMFTYRL